MSRRKKKGPSTAAMRAERLRLAAEVAKLEAKAARLRAQVAQLRPGVDALVHALEEADMSLLDAELSARRARTDEGDVVAVVASLLRNAINALARAVGVREVDNA